MKGTDNARADALSRKPGYKENNQSKPFAIFKKKDGKIVFNRAEIAAFTQVDSDQWTEQIKAAYENDNSQQMV